jgi:hypothetical protein
MCKKASYRSRARRQAFANHSGFVLVAFGVFKLGVQHDVEVFRRHHVQSGFFRDDAFVEQGDRDLHSCFASALSISSLEEVELA